MEALDYYRRQGIGTGRVGFGQHPALLVVDMQRDFLDPAVHFYLGDEARQVIPPLAKLLQRARHAGAQVVYTKNVHRPDLKDAGCWPYKFTRLQEGGLREGSPGAEVIPELAPTGQDYVLAKRRPSAFFGTDLDIYLRAQGIDTVIVTGCTTSGCVRATAVDSFSYGYRTVVPRECVVDRAAAPHAANLFDLDMKYSDVVGLDEVLEYLGSFHYRNGE